MDYYELDKWKDFVLSVLVEKGGSTLTDHIWNRLVYDLNVEDDQASYDRYTNGVLLCLENEFQLIRTSGAKGIQITEKGKQVAKDGYRSYMNSLKRQETIRKWNEYLGFTTAVMTILTTIFSFANLHFEWMDKWGVCIQTGLLVILFIAIKLFGKSK